jgi:secreted trypsin-like serine protease
VQPRFVETIQRAGATPNRDPNRIKNWGDLAVIGFSGSLPAGYSPVAIAGEDQLVDGETVLLAGYGETDGREAIASSHLKAVAVRVQKARYAKSEFTVDQTDGKGACHGDSGGPAFVARGNELHLVGITSRGFDDVCGKASVYTRVSSFLAWIQSAV